MLGFDVYEVLLLGKIAKLVECVDLVVFSFGIFEYYLVMEVAWRFGVLVWIEIDLVYEWE